MNRLIDNDYGIFEFINPKDNDSFSNMSGKELQELICRLNKYYLELRNTLNLNDTITFGFELEFEYADTVKIIYELNRYKLLDDWHIVSDISLDEGAEIDSPVLKDDMIYWNELKRVCSIVKENAIIGNNSAGHIHIGTQVLGSNHIYWLNFLKLWSVYEKIIFRFLYGEQLTARKSLTEYAYPVREMFKEEYSKIIEYNTNSISTGLILDKVKSDLGDRAINFANCMYDSLDELKYSNTIEFRCPNGTLEPIIWQNNLNLLVNILMYSKSKKFDNDTIDLRESVNKDEFNDLEWYDEIYLIDALELCDMIFNNNLDKLYFLRQYLKNFEVYQEDIKCHNFIKKI